MSMPAFRCCSTTWRTARSISAAITLGSNVSPASRRINKSESFSLRGRLPTWVVRMRSRLLIMGAPNACAGEAGTIAAIGPGRSMPAGYGADNPVGEEACAAYGSTSRPRGWVFLLTRLLLLQHMYCEIFISVCIHLNRYPAGTAREGAERFERELVAVFGMDRLAGTEVEGFSGNVYFLTLAARQIDFDATAFAVVAGVVLERGQVKIRAKLAVDAGLKIKIEFGCDPGGIIIGGMQDILVLDQIGADDEQGVASENTRRMSEQVGRLMRLEIADGGAREEADAGATL